MHRIFLAIRIFFLTLFKAAIAQQVDKLLGGAQPPQVRLRRNPNSRRRPNRPVRSDAITLLATLQRKARFVDFIQESLAGYSDAQIGAVARDVHRDSAAVINRLFALKPAVSRRGRQHRWTCPPVSTPGDSA